MNTLKNLPANHPFFEIYKSPKPAPKIKEAVVIVRSVISKEIDADWDVYHAEIEAAFNKAGIIFFDIMDEDATSSYLNSKKVSDSDIIDFLESFTESYFRILTPEEMKAWKIQQDDIEACQRGE